MRVDVRETNAYSLPRSSPSRTVARRGDYAPVPTGYRARIRNTSKDQREEEEERAQAEGVAMEGAKKSSGHK